MARRDGGTARHQEVSRAVVTIATRIKHVKRLTLHALHRLQKTTNPLLKKTPTKRIIKEILDSLNASNSTGVIRITKAAVQALIDKADAFMTEFLGEAGHEATKAKRKTIMIQDIREAKRLHVDFLTMDRRPQYQHKSPKEEQPEDQPESIVPVDAPEQLEESTDEEYVDAAQPEEPPSEPDETASA